MGDAIRVEGPINAAGLTMSIETGKLAALADGAVVVQVGDTVVLSTVATSKPRDGIDFFPLTVDVEERMYAAGKIPGSFFRREGRPGESAILTCRLTDRPLRPSFPSDFRNEVQVIAEEALAALVLGDHLMRHVGLEVHEAFGRGLDLLLHFFERLRHVLRLQVVLVLEVADECHPIALLAALQGRRSHVPAERVGVLLDDSGLEVQAP